jgi:prepilin-type N-terminal cleavage/methylation domain-containing protein
MNKILKSLKSRSACHFQSSKGFTLVEILVAVVILAIGILAVSQMTVMGMKVNTVVNQRMYARVVLCQMFEELTNLPTDAAELINDGDNGDLNDTTNQADHARTVANPQAFYSYLVRWNVADFMPDSAVKTVRIHVLWGRNNKNRIRTDFMKRMEEEG